MKIYFVCMLCVVVYSEESPFEVYNRYYQAVQKDDAETIVSLLSSKNTAIREKIEANIAVLKQQLPSNIKFISQDVNPTGAVLVIKGERFDALTKQVKFVIGNITFGIEEGGLKIISQKWEEVIESSDNKVTTVTEKEIENLEEFIRDLDTVVDNGIRNIRRVSQVDDEIVILTKEVIFIITYINKINSILKDLRAELDILKGQGFRTESFDESSRIMSIVANRKAAIESLLKKTQNLLRLASIKVEEIEQIKNKVAFEREIKAKEEAERERLRQEEEKKKEEEKRIEALAADEILKIKELIFNMSGMVNANDFIPIVDALKSFQKTLQTEKGIAELKRMVEKYELLVNLKNFLIQMLNDKPFNWGWVHSAINREDITGADDKGVKLRTKFVPWNEVPPQQFYRIAMHYLDNPGYATVKHRSYMLLGTAIYCYLRGMMKEAQDTLLLAITIRDETRSDAKRLLPEIPLETFM